MSAPDDRLGRPFDRGLQVERTALAWRRTALALTVVAVAGARVLSIHWGSWALAPGVLGLAAAVALGVAARERSRTQHRRLALAAGERVALPGGALLLAVAGTVLLAGAAALAFALAA